MQPMDTPPPKAGKVAFQQGLIFGLIQAVIASSVAFINVLMNSNTSGTAASANVGISFILAGVVFLLGLAAYFVAGILAAKRTGKVSTGTFAGMWAGAIYGVLGCVVTVVILFTFTVPRMVTVFTTTSTTSTPSLSPQSLQNFVIAGAVGGAIFGIFWAFGLGAGLGALGGLIGKNSSKVVPAPAYQAYPPQMYPDQSVPYPPYPSQPYPGQSAPYQPYPAQPYPPQENAEQPGSNPYTEQPY